MSTSVDQQAQNLSLESTNQRRYTSRVARLINRFFRLYGADLFDAVRSENKTGVQQLLEKGMHINVYDRSRYTPLHRAVLSNSEVMVRLLFERGGEHQRRK